MILKKTILALLFTVICLTVSSQNIKEFITAKVDYFVQVHIDKNKNRYKIQEKYSPGLVARGENMASEVDFSLVFNDSTSVFYLEKKLFSDNRAAKFVLRNASYYGRIKQNTSNYITEELEEDFGRFLVSREYQNWELQNESKVIGEYTCFKATTFCTTTNPKGKIFKHNFTAWYTPQLPYKYGPAGYGNLPGLIIELQGDNFTYGVKKIQFYGDDEKSKINEMPNLKRLKLISEEKFEALAEIDEKRWQKKHN
ncbi:GLPGLI family protein [Cellulophaga sp. 20_2_10]|uniref:GLPGLI family protein n=1 Tax=Cellulophaga sp. 20_2_10 TaxID=2942476 RepID=UPI00201A8273|nr:GLPGLI family protein [Cellulophaga sp. 20_2_10]MCL5244348.1 GLPGLI family protein [Cellulophaga sp. 20_2_10]